MASNLTVLCIDKIFENLKTDYKTLHSCIFVNSNWCRQGIPFLWYNPFQTAINPALLINTLFLCLPKIEKQKYGLTSKNNDTSTSVSSYDQDNDDTLKPMFPYDSLIKKFSLSDLFVAINEWCSPVPHKRTSRKLLKTFCQHLIEAAKFEELELDFDRLEFFNNDEWDGDSEEWDILRWSCAKNSCSNLQRLQISGEYPAGILYSATQLCSNLEAISVTLNPSSHSIAISPILPDNKVFERIDYLIALIAAQFSLTSITISKYHDWESPQDLQGLFDVLVLHSSFLRYIEFCEINLSEQYMILDILSIHQQLEQIVFRDCLLFNSDYYPKLPIESFSKLLVLEFRDTFVAKSVISLLMLHSASSLRELILVGSVPFDTIEFLQDYASNNPNIEKFEVYLLSDQLPSILHVIEIWKHMKSLTFHIHFLMETKAEIPILKFPNSTCISDNHLELILEYGFVEYLDISSARFVTKNGIENARKNFHVVFHE
ncbi:11543_t:CDS:2 [Ambispora gerdemannii]|uniref:11543_t:CDS:1 n=1 Tax=Ambispora gerdemannii TaxID=144530 RepID=A0A9N9BGG5_9GLOM|nr:11543_t:CDS:2 [Ambispora gerdemannii]